MCAASVRHLSALSVVFARARNTKGTCYLLVISKGNRYLLKYNIMLLCLRHQEYLIPGAYYHIISRGNNKSKLFLDDADRIQYLSLLTECIEEFDLRIYAYVLMSNHVHLFLKTSQANISDFMRRLNLDYTKYFNKRHKERGIFSSLDLKASLILS